MQYLTSLLMTRPCCCVFPGWLENKRREVRAVYQIGPFLITKNKGPFPHLTYMFILTDMSAADVVG